MPEPESDRLQPVGAGFLWEGDWPARFARAGQIPAFQAAQNEAQRFLSLKVRSRELRIQ